MNPYPGPRSVLFLDNARIHNKAQIEEACAECGVFVIFLPPYSYDYNPIEGGFHMGKAKLCRDVVDEDPHLPLQEHLRAALLTCCGSNEACNIFVHCGFPVTDEERDWAEY
jgi:transposase